MSTNLYQTPKKKPTGQNNNQNVENSKQSDNSRPRVNSSFTPNEGMLSNKKSKTTYNQSTMPRTEQASPMFRPNTSTSFDSNQIPQTTNTSFDLYTTPQRTKTSPESHKRTVPNAPVKARLNFSFGSNNTKNVSGRRNSLTGPGSRFSRANSDSSSHVSATTQESNTPPPATPFEDKNATNRNDSFSIGQRNRPRTNTDEHQQTEPVEASLKDPLLSEPIEYPRGNNRAYLSSIEGDIDSWGESENPDHNASSAGLFKVDISQASAHSADRPISKAIVTYVLERYVDIDTDVRFVKLVAGALPGTKSFLDLIDVKDEKDGSIRLTDSRDKLRVKLYYDYKEQLSYAWTRALSKVKELIDPKFANTKPWNKAETLFQHAASKSEKFMICLVQLVAFYYTTRGAASAPRYKSHHMINERRDELNNIIKSLLRELHKTFHVVHPDIAYKFLF